MIINFHTSNYSKVFLGIFYEFKDNQIISGLFNVKHVQ